ncbi:hypothetical protein [Streptomyces clavuligerus]|uniref:hypothetical protein n=1 Tax=Streptomyces clavuligerus TaxID=1901 RepID=UPI0018D0FBA0|nr:hypothetical protein [Streptomyces clavuligerus]
MTLLTRRRTINRAAAPAKSITHIPAGQPIGFQGRRTVHLHDRNITSAWTSEADIRVQEVSGVQRLRRLTVVAAATAACTFAGVGTAAADTTATNGGMATASFLSYGDIITVTHYNHDPEFPISESWAEWYTSYGRTGTCGKTKSVVQCRPNVAENRTINIRVCTHYSFLNPPNCGAYRESPTT